jgi:hypothetical protein
MDYNSRMSQQLRQAQSGRGGQNKKKENDGDEFMRLVSRICYVQKKPEADGYTIV